MIKAILVRKNLDNGVYDQNKGFRLGSREWTAEERRLKQLFRDDALTELGLVNHPKAEEIFAFARKHAESGLSSGETTNLILENLEFIANIVVL